MLSQGTLLNVGFCVYSTNNKLVKLLLAFWWLYSQLAIVPQLEIYQIKMFLQQKLGERLEQVEKSKRDTESHLKVELSEAKAQLDKENVEREEQLRRHSDTIRALEEQIDKTVNMNKDYQAEIAGLKASVAG